MRFSMIAPYLPAILVPIFGIFLPGIAMAILFVSIEKESVE
jgi:photosystem I reaction center subunit VIII